MPAVTAQAFGAPGPNAVPYDAFCEEYGRGRDLSALVTQHGRNGFRLTSNVIHYGSFACFERPAQ